MCRKITLGEVAGKRIVCDENFTCLTILAPALIDRAISANRVVNFALDRAYMKIRNTQLVLYR